MKKSKIKKVKKVPVLFKNGGRLDESLLFSEKDCSFKKGISKILLHSLIIYFVTPYLLRNILILDIVQVVRTAVCGTENVSSSLAIHP